MAEVTETPPGVTRTPDGGLWVGPSRIEQLIGTLVTGIAVVLGLVLAAAGVALQAVLGADGPGTTFVVVGMVIAVGGGLVGVRLRRRDAVAGWGIDAWGLRRRDGRPAQVAWPDVAELTLWDRRERPRASSPWLRLVSVCATDAHGQVVFETPTDNDDRRIIAVVDRARAEGLVPAHVRFTRRTD